MLPCQHMTCRECVLTNFAAQEQRESPTTCPICSEPADEDSLEDVGGDSPKNGKPVKNEVIELGDSDDDTDGEAAPLFRESSESGVEANKEDDDMMANDFRSSTKLNAVLRHIKALKAKESK